MATILHSAGRKKKTNLMPVWGNPEHTKASQRQQPSQRGKLEPMAMGSLGSSPLPP